MLKLSFFGAAETVTGSRHLLQIGQTRILVDCGLFQGYKTLRLRNWDQLPFDPSDLHAVVLTHAHIDHSGALPLLVRHGYTGPIYCTRPTRDLLKILLPDSASLQAEDAAFANKHGFSRHHPARALYEMSDVKQTLKQLVTVEFDETTEIAPGVTCDWFEAGHILGAASIRVNTKLGRVLFSGDLGRDDDLLMRPPTGNIQTDWVVMESTYGDRLQSQDDPLDLLAAHIKRVAQRGGSILIPSFAVGRAQAMLYCLHQLLEQERIPPVPVFLDSPMANKATDLYARHASFERITTEEAKAIRALPQVAHSVQQSQAIDRSNVPKVIVSASGMLTGGRSVHHLKAMVSNPANLILLPGYQAGGTRGARLADGDAEIKIHGQYFPVRAQVAQMDTFSAHADQQGLLDWATSLQGPVRGYFLVHGEPRALDCLRGRLDDRVDCPVTVAEFKGSVRLDSHQAS